MSAPKLTRTSLYVWGTRTVLLRAVRAGGAGQLGPGDPSTEPASSVPRVPCDVVPQVGAACHDNGDGSYTITQTLAKRGKYEVSLLYLL